MIFDYLKKFFPGKDSKNIGSAIDKTPISPIDLDKIKIPEIKHEHKKEDFSPIDKFQNYFNFVLPKPRASIIETRLGKFQVMGEPVRDKKTYIKSIEKFYPAPVVGVLHVPAGDIIRSGKDVTAESCARYLATGGSSASVHLCSDRDSCILCLPFDMVGYHCANPRTHQFSIGIEIGGLGEGKDSYKGIKGDLYWSTDDAILKYRQTAIGLIEGFRLLYPKYWKEYFIPFQKAETTSNGSYKTSGWTQHREIPIYNRARKIFNQVGSGGKNQVLGQHVDIAANFPWDLFFQIIQEEINKR